MESQLLTVDQLRLDPDNPRLPEAVIGKSQSELLKWLNLEGVLNELASSMVTNGFFPHEPLIVKLEDDGRYTVVEGNRRFATLTILQQLPPAVEAELSFDFQVPPTRERLQELRNVPCFVVEDKEEVRKFLGFRHIGGIKTWSPEAKARYLDIEVRRALDEGSENVFRDVGRLVGSNAAGVRGPYIALHILRGARDLYGIDATFVMQNRFGVWNRMMNSADLRDYIGFGTASTAEEVAEAVGGMSETRLSEVIGDLTPQDGQRRAVLSDSRDVTAYAAVLQNVNARKALRRTLDLELARQVVDRSNFGAKIRRLAQSVELLLRDIETADVNEEAHASALNLRTNARTLAAGISERLNPDDDD